MKLFLVILIFFLVGYKTIDPDLGWHLRMGEIVSNTGIPTTDPFSYTMPSYKYVDYEWLTNLTWYKTFSFLGVSGWIAIFAVALVFIMKILLPGEANIYWWTASLLIWSTLINRFGMRAQVLNWTFWALLTRGMYDQSFWLKYRKFYPLLILFWSNLHGSYVFGILMTSIWIFFNGLQKKDVIVWLTGTILTLVNPYGIRNWQEVVIQMQQVGFYRRTVAEWGPFYNLVEPGFWLGVILSLFFTKEFKKYNPLSTLVILFICLWSALTSHRFVPIFMIFAGPLVFNNLINFEKLVKKSKESLTRLNIFNQYLAGFALIIFFFIAVNAYKAGKSIYEEQFYPKEAVNYLVENNIEGRIFSPYDWAGYMIWKMPEQKVFVDGRMPGFSLSKLEGESKQAFVEYLEIVGDEEKWKMAVEKYDIKTVLWFNSDVFSLEKEISEVYKKFVNQLEKNKWRKIYEDKIAVVFTKQAGQ